ncbi:MAG: cytochrome b [Gluconobacter sp.]|uniref:cytochrome b n=1 Tax=Gluconobacter sp. TaxID=1876758 RepID=UPI0039ED2E97
MDNTPAPFQCYSLVARLFHWSMAAIIIPLWLLGFYVGRIMPHAATPQKALLLLIHKEIGPFIIILTVLRLVWRATHRPPTMSSDIPEEERLAVQVGHFALYAMMLVVPLTGWVRSSVHGLPIPMMWVVDLPPLAHKAPVFVPLVNVLHQFSSWILGVLIAGHGIAALLHRYGRRDTVMNRML